MSLAIGIIAVQIVILAALGLDQLKFYLQWHSFLIVGGGTAAIFFLATPISIIKHTLKNFLGLFKSEEAFGKQKDALVALAKNKNAEVKSEYPLIQYANELWTQGVENDLFIVLLSQRKNEMLSEKIDSIQALKNLAKYPPALGMTGTVMGMVSLFMNLDSQKESIGGFLALAMTATFFGLILTNAALSPLADRMQIRHVTEQRLLQSIYEMLLLINQGEAETLIADEVKYRETA